MRDNAFEESVSVAVQGELGSNSELAGREYFEGRRVTIVPCHTFADLFAAVRDGSARFGMAPVDNALGGSIHDVWELFAESPLPIDGEIFLRINHCLIGHPGSSSADIKRIYSHPQAIAQCRDFLDGLANVQVEEVYDTAGAVKMIKVQGMKGAAAIASAQAAADYEMEILVEDLQPRRDNYTRFLVLSHAPRSPDGDDLKTTAVVTVDDTGDLAAVIEPFQSRGIRILKSERSPVRRDLIYLEFAGSPGDSEVSEALTAVGEVVRHFCEVGSYPPGRRVEPRIHIR